MTSIRRVTRLALVAIPAAGLLTLLAACGGFSDEEAAARCEQERSARGAQACFGNVEYDSCVSAFTECGDDVVIVDACPPQFTCPDGAAPEESEAE